MNIINHDIQLNLLGEVRVFRDGVELKLPPSKKARALLGYLAITGRPNRRERLCELFWELPDDPRGSLRWALSKLRNSIEKGEIKHIVADRERVAIDTAQADIDFVRIRNRLFDKPDFIPPRELQQMADSLSRPLMDGLNNAGKEVFQSWLAAEREDAHVMLSNVFRRLALHPELKPEEIVKWARFWQEADPFNFDAAFAFANSLLACGRKQEADQFENRFKNTAREAGLKPPEFTKNNTVQQFQIEDQFATERSSPPRRMLRQQNIGFCKAKDGARIAYASVGSGPPFVKAANWLNHLELDWDSPIWGRTFGAAAKGGRTFIRYDERGNGLSDWEVEDISFEAFVRDLETVVDALDLEKFPLLGISQGCAVSIEYAVRHPERVSCLVLISGYATGCALGHLPKNKNGERLS